MIQILSKLGLFIAVLICSACVVVPDGNYGGGPAYYDGYYDYAPVYPWAAGVNVYVDDFGRGRGHYDHGGFRGHGRGGRR